MNKETIDNILNIQLSVYIDTECKFCKHKFSSVEDIKEKDIIYAGKDKDGEQLYACSVCWEEGKLK